MGAPQEDPAAPDELLAPPPAELAAPIEPAGLAAAAAAGGLADHPALQALQGLPHDVVAAAAGALAEAAAGVPTWPALQAVGDGAVAAVAAPSFVEVPGSAQQVLPAAPGSSPAAPAAAQAGVEAAAGGLRSRRWRQQRGAAAAA